MAHPHGVFDPKKMTNPTSNNVSPRKTISIIVPVYQNEKNIPVTFDVLSSELKKLPSDFNYELIFVDDGSSDNSYRELLKLHDADPSHVKLVKLSRNFGQVAAVTAGFEVVEGDALIVLSADLQDPPELIHRFVREWDVNDKEIVIAARASRDDGFLPRLFSSIFYKFMRKYAVQSIPKGGFDYFLISRRVLNVIHQMREKNSFLQGQILWTGFSPEIIPYNRMKREIGFSQWNLGKRIKYFIDGFITYSYFPIRFISVCGIITAFSGFLYAVLILIMRLTANIPIKGWAPLMIVLLTVSGIQMIMLGIIGEYLWRNYDETRKRPIYVVETIVKCSK